jgi:hypothetical protein
LLHKRWGIFLVLFDLFTDQNHQIEEASCGKEPRGAFLVSKGGITMSQPEITFRHGPCSASVFENEYERGDRKFAVRNVTFQRSYQDKDGNWQTTSSLKVNDIPKAVLVLNKCYEFLTSNGILDSDTEET